MFWREFMKENKLLGALNYVFSAISSIIVIIFVHLPLVIFTSDIQIYALDDKYNVYNLLSLSNTNAQFMDSSNLGVLAGVFAIIAFALAVVILIASIFMILKKFGVYDWKLDGKFSDFDLISTRWLRYWRLLRSACSWLPISSKTRKFKISTTSLCPSRLLQSCCLQFPLRCALQCGLTAA